MENENDRYNACIVDILMPFYSVLLNTAFNMEISKQALQMLSIFLFKSEPLTSFVLINSAIYKYFYPALEGQSHFSISIFTEVQGNGSFT